MSLTALSLYSSAECSTIASFSSSIFDFESFRSKRVWISFNACWIAFETSCRSILLTTSKLLSGIFLFFQKQWNLYTRLTELQGQREGTLFSVVSANLKKL